MADDPSKTGTDDDIRVNVSQRWERDYWTRKLGCTAPELRAAAKAAGPMVNDIRKHLKGAAP